MAQSGEVSSPPGGWTTNQLAWACIGSFVAGAIALYAVGFHLIGQWQTGTAVDQKLAVAACVENFLLQPDRGFIYTELQGNSSSYQRRRLIREHKLASDRDVAGMCDDRILGMDPGYFEVPETAAANIRQRA